MISSVAETKDVVADKRRRLAYFEAGSQNTLQRARRLLTGMKARTKKHNKSYPTNPWNAPEFTPEDIVEIARKTPEYVVNETIRFPLLWTNGSRYSASPDRIDDALGYTKANVSWRPVLLNAPLAWRSEEIIETRSASISDAPDDWKRDVEAMLASTTIATHASLMWSFYERAGGALERNLYKYGITKEDGKRKLAALFLKKFVEQGGRCFYSNRPMTFKRGYSRNKMSPERLDATKPYSEENVVLICVALNASPGKEHTRGALTEEQRRVVGKTRSIDRGEWLRMMGYSNAEMQRMNALAARDIAWARSHYTGVPGNTVLRQRLYLRDIATNVAYDFESYSSAGRKMHVSASVVHKALRKGHIILGRYRGAFDPPIDGEIIDGAMFVLPDEAQKRGSSIGLSAKNETTGETKEFSSVVEFAAHAGVPRDRVDRALKNDGVFDAWRVVRLS